MSTDIEKELKEYREKLEKELPDGLYRLDETSLAGKGAYIHLMVSIKKQAIIAQNKYFQK